jgi:YfiR/HmsC-like
VGAALQGAQEIQGCQVLFIGIADKEFTSATLANLNGTPALTVGESEHFVQEGGNDRLLSGGQQGPLRNQSHCGGARQIEDQRQVVVTREYGHRKSKRNLECRSLKIHRFNASWLLSLCAPASSVSALRAW